MSQRYREQVEEQCAPPRAPRGHDRLCRRSRSPMCKKQYVCTKKVTIHIKQPTPVGAAPNLAHPPLPWVQNQKRKEKGGKKGKKEGSFPGILWSLLRGFLSSVSISARYSLRFRGLKRACVNLCSRAGVYGPCVILHIRGSVYGETLYSRSWPRLYSRSWPPPPAQRRGGGSPQRRHLQSNAQIWHFDNYFGIEIGGSIYLYPEDLSATKLRNYTSQAYKRSASSFWTLKWKRKPIYGIVHI